ncbi:MAG: MATE family efflux transporter, partial [Gemmiger qucibialis]
GNLGYNMNAGILRGLGDSRSTLLLLLISCLTNIVLDVAFVAVPTAASAAESQKLPTTRVSTVP